jgi:DNA polymerase-3 subunit delta
MNKNELDRHIQKGSCSNSAVLFGASSFLIDRYTELLSKKVDASILSFYFDEYNFTSAKAHLSQASLFGGDNVLIVKSEKKVAKKELDILIDLCEKNQDNTFIYAYYGSDHKTYTKAFSKKSTMSVRFFNPNLGESINIVTQVARNKSVNIDSNSIAHLLNLHNHDIALACNEIEKFMVFDTAITIKEIDNLVHGLADISINDLITKLFNKKDFKDDVKNILDHGEDEIRVITNIISYITQLYMFNIYIRVNGAPNALEILGYPAPQFIVNEQASMSLKFKPDMYYKLHELLLDSELKMKSSNVDKNAILLSTLIRIQQLL